MKRTENNVEKIRVIMNENPMIQNIMDGLAKRAEQQGITKEQWNDMKQKAFMTVFLKVCEMCPEIKNDLAMDIYEELNA